MREEKRGKRGMEIIPYPRQSRSNHVNVLNIALTPNPDQSISAREHILQCIRAKQHEAI